jgi:hypothetical protein
MPKLASSVAILAEAAVMLEMRSILLRFFTEMKSLGIKPCTSAPSLERNREVSKKVIEEMPESPLKSLREKAFLPIPRGVTMPTPDMTTLSFMERNFLHNIHANRFGRL